MNQLTNYPFHLDSEEEEPKEKNSPIRERIEEQFLNQRQVHLWGPVHDKSAAPIVQRLLYLEFQDPGKPIMFLINSPGGVITSGYAIYDIMNMITSPVYTVTMGMAASMGAILFAAGEKGHRYMFEHAKVMIHQPLISGQIVAPAIDIKIHADEIKKTRVELNRILADATGKSIKQIEADTDRDYYMNSKEALQYGIADKSLKQIEDLPWPNLPQNSSKKKTATKKKANTKKKN